MKQVSRQSILEPKESLNGVFWVIDGVLLAYPFGSVDTIDGIAKSANTYNHKRLWNDIKPAGIKFPYNYYPRGRVAINAKGKPIIYMNSNIEDSLIVEIKEKLGIRVQPRIVYDNSEHYKCYLDDGWKPDNK